MQGDVLSISADYVEKSLAAEPQLIEAIQEILVLSQANNSPLFKQTVLSKDQFIQEWREENEQKSLALKAYFLLLMTNLFRLYQLKSGNMLTENKASLNYFQQFKKLIKIHLTDHWPVPVYAKELGISRIHLNRICQEINDTSAHQMIQNQLIVEAKNYLLNSPYRISEIAYLLNFKDPAYFTRVFKNATGVTPREFLKN
jgi:AraC family transcriptional activator of pobA